MQHLNPFKIPAKTIKKHTHKNIGRGGQSMNKEKSMNTELSSDLKRIKHDVTSAPLENCDFVSDLYDSKHIILIKTEKQDERR